MRHPEADELARAAAALRAGRLVVFPTETVYGVGAHALDPEAVARIFSAKGRPPDNPLIVHVEDAAAARPLVREWPEAAQRLAEAFWPGPLTLVLPRADGVPDLTTAGLDSVAIRVPDHPVAQALLRAAGVPVAAPSANRSGRPSPTRIAHAREDLGDAVDVYLDAGPTRVGLESTVVGLMGPRPSLLRVGGVSQEDVEAVVGPLAHAADDARRSPGTRHRHYAPRARVHVVEGNLEALEGMAARLRAEGLRVAVIASVENAPSGALIPGSRTDAEAWARGIFDLLRACDASGAEAIVVETIPESGLGAAVMDRLRRAQQR